jgi:cytochrome P450
MSFGWLIAFLEPGPHHTERKKMVRKGLGPQRIGAHEEKVESNADKLMLTFNDFRGDPLPHLLMCVLVPQKGYTLTINLVLWGIYPLKLHTARRSGPHWART